MTAAAPEGAARLGRGLRELAALAVPLSLAQLGMQLMTVVDTAMLGRYSEASLAGAGLAGTILFAITVLGMGTIMGLDTLAPQALGAGDPARARALFGSGWRLALLLSVPVSLLIAAVALVLPATAVEHGVAEKASIYLLGRLPGIAPMLVAVAMRCYLQAHHITRPMVLAVVVANALNLVADAVLIFGDAALTRVGLPAVGLPALGVVGAALATSATSTVSMVIYGLAVRRLHRGAAGAGADAGTRDRRGTAGLTRSIIKLGGPVGLQLVAEVGIFALTGFLAGTMGRLPAAAHQIALTLASFSFSAALGIGAATSVQVGRAVGAGNTAAARQSGALGMATAAAIMGTMGLCFLVFPRELASLFTGDPVIKSAAVPLLRIAAVFQLSDAVQAVSAGALRGAGDTRFTSIANVFGHYAVGVPVAALLGFAAHLGAAGLWWGLSAGLTTVAVGQSIRFGRLTRRPIERS